MASKKEIITYNFVVDRYLELSEIQDTIDRLFGNDYVIIPSGYDLSYILIFLGEIKEPNEYIYKYGQEADLQQGVTTKMLKSKNCEFRKKICVYKPSIYETYENLTYNHL
jgi:hypothetical protein